ncbi:hypothetical protein [Vibrio parahaemolyticus]|uniref:hypothetical protein n=1 Tax=Vibrio parahaemolyticus TaxID=670 RepID=UPI00111CE8B9|nr:hypothetical protein [Vibrio parahaemolyticus]TOL25179.1 hypothetical protein CGI02_13360 [Vibrio parahaemolyticus]
MKNYFKSLFEEQPEERFFNLKLTKAVILYFGIAFIITFLISLREAITLELSLDSAGVNYLVFELFKAPVAVAGFALPILGLIGLNHRSEQTKKQIAGATLQLASSERQNLFNNYFKHLEEFIKHVTRNLKSGEVNTSTLRHGHDFLYPNSLSEGDFSINPDAIEGIEKYLIQAIEFLESIKDKTDITRGIDLLEEISDFQRKFSVIPPSVSGVVNVAATAEDRHAKIIDAYEEVMCGFSRQLNVVGFSTDLKWRGQVIEQMKNMTHHINKIRDDIIYKKA